jgi:hypothetical protein
MQSIAVGRKDPMHLYYDLTLRALAELYVSCVITQLTVVCLTSVYVM